MSNKFRIMSIVSLSLAIIVMGLLIYKVIINNNINNEIKVSLNDLTYSVKDKNEGLKLYEISDFNNFLTDFNNNNLPSVYVTKFLFDGVAMYKPYDLDDFIENGNDYVVDPLEITVININNVGDTILSGEITGGMIAVNTNNVKGDINIILDGVKIDTDSKKVPVVYVYNKDRTYTDTKVTIKTLNNTKNYLEGGKLKKVSLIPSDNLSEYSNKYTGDNNNNYLEYTNYYGVYSSDDINNILFATVTADNEDLADGDPNYFYKASGAISSDIDLYFNGEGYLEVTSKNKEGIETKGNLTFDGGSGNYVITAMDDCLNTTTDSKEISNARNALTIDVNSLYAIVSNDSDEGDAIDSNGELIINGGTILAVAKPGADAGIDSETGTYINGGVVYATGDMYDEVKSDSKQRFMTLSFASRLNEDDILTLTDESNNVIFSYKTDRTFSNFIYSSDALTDSTYYLYKNGTINGTPDYGLYNNITEFKDGIQLGYANSGNTYGNFSNDNGNPPDMPSGNNMTPPSGSMPNGNTLPDKPSGSDNMIPSNRGDNNGNPPSIPNNNDNATTASNKDFTLNGIANMFSGIAVYSE